MNQEAFDSTVEEAKHFADRNRAEGFFIGERKREEGEPPINAPYTYSMFYLDKRDSLNFFAGHNIIAIAAYIRHNGFYLREDSLLEK